jgi:flagellin
VGCATASALGLGTLTGSKNKYTADQIANAATELERAQMLAENNAGKSISTQELAQQTLEAINQAIISKDKIRAALGAMQNRLENTITNLSIQAENLQASESRISDVDVATEMTEFTRQQILAQSAVAMLAQANQLPKMALQLIQG